MSFPISCRRTSDVARCVQVDGARPFCRRILARTLHHSSDFLEHQEVSWSSISVGRGRVHPDHARYRVADIAIGVRPRRLEEEGVSRLEHNRFAVYRQLEPSLDDIADLLTFMFDGAIAGTSDIDNM